MRPPIGRLAASTPHTAATSSRARASSAGRPPGSRPARAPASSAPRSPARRGTQPSRAPVLEARSAAAESAPGTPAIRSPTRMTAPGCRRAARVPPVSPPRSSRSALASPPGSQAHHSASILTVPRVRTGDSAMTRGPPLRVAARRRRKMMGDSSSGSRPTRSTTGARSRSAYVGPSGMPATDDARNCDSSSLATRARKSMSPVPIATRANFA